MGVVSKYWQRPLCVFGDNETVLMNVFIHRSYMFASTKVWRICVANLQAPTVDGMIEVHCKEIEK